MNAFFFPNEENVSKMQYYIKKAKKTIDLCIFWLSDNKLAEELIEAHKRGVKIRMITDDEAMKANGADAQRLCDAGIQVRTDYARRYHMHNKYMIVDSLFLVTGSYNWTVQAGKSNQENVIVVDDKYFIQKYNGNFGDLWAQFSDNELEQREHAAVLKLQDSFRRFKNSSKLERRKQRHEMPWDTSSGKTTPESTKV